MHMHLISRPGSGLSSSLGMDEGNMWAVSFHPGVVETGFAREGGGLVKWFYEGPFGRFFMITPEKGADTLRWLINTVPGKDWQDGEYYYKRRPGR